VTRFHRPDGPVPARKSHDEVEAGVAQGRAASEIREKFIGRSLAVDPAGRVDAIHLHELSREDA
jgi:hypothetical protein